MIPKSALIPAEFYQGYIDLIKEEDFREAIRKNTKQFRKLTEGISRKKFDYAYADGKWTIREMLQHIIDAERVFSYRALTFSRKDASPLPGFDENNWAAQAGGSNRRWKDLLEEFASVRQATQYLYDSLSDDQLTFAGQANGRPLNGYTLGFIIPGHVAHHMRILRERYL
ncbi:MAG: DinB family protein [Bacteroidetes bacterium]|nr:DinB family protein [Bacteroidota bacterium]